jgi:hypothetical protein
VIRVLGAAEVTTHEASATVADSPIATVGSSPSEDPDFCFPLEDSAPAGAGSEDSDPEDPNSESVDGSTLAMRAKHPPTVNSPSKTGPMHPPIANFIPVPIPDLCVAGGGGA